MEAKRTAITCPKGHPVHRVPFWPLEEVHGGLTLAEAEEIIRDQAAPIVWREDRGSVVLEAVVPGLGGRGWEVGSMDDIVCLECGEPQDRDLFVAGLEAALHASYRAEAIPEPLTTGSKTLDEAVAALTAMVRAERPDFTIDVARAWAIELLKDALAPGRKPRA